MKFVSLLKVISENNADFTYFYILSDGGKHFKKIRKGFPPISRTRSLCVNITQRAFYYDSSSGTKNLQGCGMEQAPLNC